MRASTVDEWIARGKTLPHPDGKEGPVAAAEDLPDLAIVIPAFNEEARIDASLSEVGRFLSESGRQAEVLVVDDGSSDRTAERVVHASQADSRIRLLRLPHNRGKGAAVRTGVMAAVADRVLVSDADLSTPLAEIAKLEDAIERGHDVAIGSRGLSTSDIRRRQPFYREAMGKTFNRIIRTVLLDGFEDTQCGFKLFPRDIAHDLFRLQRVDGFAFDVEILLLARDRGLRIAEVPVQWSHAPHSKVSAIGDSSRMLADVLRLRLARLFAPVRELRWNGDAAVVDRSTTTKPVTR